MSFPNLFNILKEMIHTWSRTNTEYFFDPKKVPTKLIEKADELMDRCNRDDKEKNLLLSKKNKSSHRTLVKKNYGAVRGHVVETSIVPVREDLFGIRKGEFATLGQEIHQRRNTVCYKTFDEFTRDINTVVFVETVFEVENQVEGCFFACSCTQAKSSSGVKGKLCCHVVLAMMEAGILKRTPPNPSISNFANKKGAPKKNKKQTS